MFLFSSLQYYYSYFFFFFASLFCLLVSCVFAFLLSIYVFFLNVQYRYIFHILHIKFTGNFSYLVRNPSHTYIVCNSSLPSSLTLYIPIALTSWLSFYMILYFEFGSGCFFFVVVDN